MPKVKIKSTVTNMWTRPSASSGTFKKTRGKGKAFAGVKKEN